MEALTEAQNRRFSGSIIDSFFSRQGRRLYFPRGIVAQAAEAEVKAFRDNATAGVAREKKEPFILPLLKDMIPGFTPSLIVDYAPTGGDSALRELWKKEIERKNPSLSGKRFSLPLVTAGITHGFSITADLFVDEHDTVVVPEPFWENYELVLKEKRNARFHTFPFFDADDTFNLKGLQRSLSGPGEPDKLMIILNFPHNPTGYTLIKTEAESLVRMLLEAAESGQKLLVLLDDAYFSLFYEHNIMTESLFAQLADLHENLLAIKLDGATKEDYAWGLRIGFLTVGAKGLKPDHYAALEEKLLAAVRTSVSSASRLSMSLLSRLFENPSRLEEEESLRLKLAARYHKVREILKSVRPGTLSPLPFNSGYFLTFRTGSLDAERLRLLLLEKKGVGTVALSRSLLRVTYASVDEENLEQFFHDVFQEAALLDQT